MDIVFGTEKQWDRWTLRVRERTRCGSDLPGDLLSLDIDIDYMLVRNKSTRALEMVRRPDAAEGFVVRFDDDSNKVAGRRNLAENSRTGKSIMTRADLLSYAISIASDGDITQEAHEALAAFMKSKGVKAPPAPRDAFLLPTPIFVAPRGIRPMDQPIPLPPIKVQPQHPPLVPVGAVSKVETSEVQSSYGAEIVRLLTEKQETDAQILTLLDTTRQLLTEIRDNAQSNR